MKSIAFEVDGLHLCSGHLPTGLVPSSVETADDLEASRRGGPGDEMHDGFVVPQWLASPVLGDEREEAMLDLIPLARAWREMADRQGPASLIRQVLEFPLPQA